MTIPDLHNKLKEAYSNENLNKICVTLIHLYKSEQWGTLSQITDMIRESIDIQTEDQGKCFARLMMLYHPDRGDFHRKEIDKLAVDQNYDGLLEYTHILLLSRIDEIAATMASFEDIDYSPVYDWDINLEGFSIINTRTSEQMQNKPRKEKQGYSFYEAIKIRIYGKTSASLMPHYLEDLDEFELSQSGINDLEGVQYCIHAINMDLSDNLICDLSLLWGLGLIEELNLSDNQIVEIEPLINLTHLRSLILSNNAIKDVSGLLLLSRLEYVDLTGNRISSQQIKQLEDSGITVVS
jgi:Leucine-rich repeat (LRR) protein